MGGIETFIVTVAAALVVGLTVMAIRKPEQYRRLFPYLAAVAFSAFFLVSSYTLGGEQVWQATKEFTGDDRMTAFEAKGAVLPDHLWVGGFFLGAVIFLLVLKILPLILDVSEDGDDEDDQKNED